MSRQIVAWASVLSPDDERLAQVPFLCSITAIREAFSGLETDAVPVQCLNVR